MLTVSAIRSSASEVTGRSYRPSGTTRADLTTARSRRSPAPSHSGLSRPMLDGATLLMAQDEQWRASPSAQGRAPRPIPPGAEAYYGLRNTGMTDTDAESPVLEYRQAPDGQYYAEGTAAPTEAPLFRNAHRIVFAGERGVEEDAAQAPQVHQNVKTYQDASRLVAEPTGLVTPPPSIAFDV